MNKEFREILLGFRRALALTSKRQRSFLLLASVIMIITGILTTLPALILGKLVDSLISQQHITASLVSPAIGIIIATILVREMLVVVRKLIVENVATQTEKEQTVRVVESLLKTDIHFLHQQHIGALHGRVFRSLQGLVRVIKLGFLDFLPIAFGAIAAIAIALSQKPLVAVVMALVIPVGLFLVIKQVASQKNVRVSLLRGKETIDGKMVEMLNGIETIRVADTVSDEVGKVEAIAERLRKTEIRHHTSMALFDAAKYLNEGGFYILVIVLSIYLSAIGTISRGDILVYSILFLSITSPLREIHRILDEAHESSIRVNDLYTLLQEPLDPSYEIVRLTTRTPQSTMVVSAKNLSFQYRDRPTGVLKNINLEIQRGQHIGIAGASGCGKTTLVQTILKLLHGYEGSLELFNTPLHEVSREEISKRIAYVPQRPFIFSGSIRENLLYGTREAYSDPQLLEMTERVHLLTELQKNLDGLDGIITESGNNLSGGQKQRIAIARALLQNPELLIFDEATSALDNTNEAIIQANIEGRFKNTTIITIAHRLTTLKNCDRIFVFDKGSIVQEGNFDTLANTAGLFKSFLEQKKA